MRLVDDHRRAPKPTRHRPAPSWHRQARQLDSPRGVVRLVGARGGTRHAPRQRTVRRPVPEAADPRMVESPALAGQAPHCSQRSSAQDYLPARVAAAARCSGEEWGLRTEVAMSGPHGGKGDQHRRPGRSSDGRHGVCRQAAGGYAHSGSDRAAFSGEIDINNCDAVARCLSEMPAKGEDVHLDVSGLIFCDISGIRAFVEAAEQREKGRLMLHGLPELLQTVMRVTGWTDLPNLEVCGCKAGSP